MTVEPKMVEHRLRETLQERATRVGPSPDAWAAITLKIDHRRRRARVVVFAMAALLPVVAVGATLAAVRDGNGAHPVDTAGPAPTPSTPTTVAAALPVPPTATTALRGTTTAPRTAVAPATTVPRTTRVWPETQTEVDEIQKSFDQGHQPWRGSPDGVTKAFLVDRGLSDRNVVPTDAGPSQVAVPYVADSVGGTVSLARARDGGVYYVTASTTERISKVDISHEDGGLVLEIQSPAEGTVSARTKKPGGAWSDFNTQPIDPGGQSRMLVGVGQSGDLILQLRHEGADGKVGMADQFIPVKVTTPPPAEALGQGSRLRVDGLGPITVGMTLAEAEGAAGVPMTRTVGPYCTELAPTGGPAGLSLVSTGAGNRVDVVTVSEPGVTTVDGIGIGSTLAEVADAYPSLERKLVNDEGRLVYRSEDPRLGEFELVIGIGEGKVTQLWAGHKGLGLQDEICA